MRIWVGSLSWGLGLAVIGVLLLLGARVGQTLQHHLRREGQSSGGRGR